MPTTYAHYRFGREVADLLPASFQKLIYNNIELFDIGVHGPDIFFYHNPLKEDAITKKGFTMHTQDASDFLIPAADIVKVSKKAGKQASYLFGFICHFVLDSYCHPYVEKIISKGEMSHSKVEMEFDRMLLVKDGLDIIKTNTASHLSEDDKNIGPIAPFFDGITPNDIKTSLRKMRYVVGLLRMPGVYTKAAIFTLLDSINMPEKKDLFMDPKYDLSCEHYNGLLFEQYEAAVKTAVEMIIKYKDYILGKSELPEYFYHNFGPGVNWEEIEL